MKATVIIDNITHNVLIAEWGLAFYIEYECQKYSDCQENGDAPELCRILLDTGASDSFADNAAALGIDLAAVDFAVLSHAHYDHANGMAAFFERNQAAPFYIGAGAAENCYHGYGPDARYIGLPQGILAAYPDRIKFADDEIRQIAPGITLIGHRKKYLAEHDIDLGKIGEKADMYICQSAETAECGHAADDTVFSDKENGLIWRPDSFDHEQSLVFETEKGLVVFNSCCHGGADNIINEISDLYPEQKIYAIIGGFHLFETPDDEVIGFAKRLRDTGVEKVITGHCTGEHACEILSQELGDMVETLYTGKIIEL